MKENLDESTTRQRKASQCIASRRQPESPKDKFANTVMQRRRLNGMCTWTGNGIEVDPPHTLCDHHVCAVAVCVCAFVQLFWSSLRCRSFGSVDVLSCGVGSRKFRFTNGWWSNVHVCPRPCPSTDRWAKLSTNRPHSGR